MSKSGWIEYCRRGVTLGLLTLGLVAIGYWGWTVAGLLIAGAIIVYLFLPRVRPPDGALTYERVPAVIGPDMIGFLLTSVFIALPFWARLGEEYLWDDFGVMVHPAAFLTWPLALICLLILVIGAGHASFWVVIEQNGLRLSSRSEVGVLPFDRIEGAMPFRRGLPKWLKWITPLLIVTGKFSAAGAILLSRDVTGMSLPLRDGSVVKIHEEAFEKPFQRILEAFRANGVPLDPVFEKRFQKR